MRTVYPKASPRDVILSEESRDQFGNLTLAQTFPNLGMVQIREGYDYTADKGIQSFYDIEVTTELRISGGKAWVRNPEDVHVDDILEFSIVDKNGIVLLPGGGGITLFEYYGLTPGVDVILLEKFLRNIRIKKGNQIDGYPMLFEPAAIHGDPLMIGLYMRASCTSNGDTDLNIYYELIYYEG